MKQNTSQEIKDFVSKPLFDEKVILNKDSSWPKISIVTPSYNQGEFLERTILSVLNQNYPNFEYIIIDGGSTDRSVEIIKKYGKYLTYWVSEKDNGQAHAIYKGFEKSTGQFLAWLNSDDTYLPGAFFKIVKAFQKYTKANLVFGNIYFSNEYDKIIGECRFTKVSINNLIYEDLSLGQQSTFWTKDIYNKVGGINPRYDFCMDFDLFTRIASFKPLFYISEYIASFRLHQHAKTSIMLKTWHRERQEIVKRYLPKEVNKLFLNYKKCLYHTQRLYYYFLQGDIKYALKKCIKRLCGISFMDELK
jgi:glycosyltransferase involved in cell wall biosynthesis